MILYRAIINDDLKELNETGKISCTLFRSYNNLENCKNIEKTKELYKLCFLDMNKDSILSLIFGHVNGKLVTNAKRSPWISLTSDFNIAYKYANLENCVEESKNRHIICIKIDNNSIINDETDINNNCITTGSIINLSNGELAGYRNNGIIAPFGQEKGIIKNGTQLMFNNYSTSDKEYLICGELNPNSYIILSPKQQEEIKKNYSDNIDEYIESLLKCKEKIITKSR